MGKLQIYFLSIAFVAFPKGKATKARCWGQHLSITFEKSYKSYKSYKCSTPVSSPARHWLSIAFVAFRRGKLQLCFLSIAFVAFPRGKLQKPGAEGSTSPLHLRKATKAIEATDAQPLSPPPARHLLSIAFVAFPRGKLQICFLSIAFVAFPKGEATKARC